VYFLGMPKTLCMQEMGTTMMVIVCVLNFHGVAVIPAAAAVAADIPDVLADTAGTVEAEEAEDLRPDDRSSASWSQVY